MNYHRNHGNKFNVKEMDESTGLYILSDSKKVRALQSHDWASFARLYNGPGYKSNKYDTKVKLYYEAYKSDPYKGYNMLPEVKVYGRQK
ncbi:MAG: N-acetylmuramidase domain-containing protein [Prevotella sp.]|jgi:hypothetical protein